VKSLFTNETFFVLTSFFRVDTLLELFAMMKHQIRRPSHHLFILFSLIFVVSFFNYSKSFAIDHTSTSSGSSAAEIDPGSQIARSFQQVSPTETIYINLPIIEQNAQTTPEPVAEDPGAVTDVEIDIGTPTPTPIPIQSGSENLPIVIGALAIIIVIILAWFFIGFLPNRSRD